MRGTLAVLTVCTPVTAQHISASLAPAPFPAAPRVEQGSPPARARGWEHSTLARAYVLCYSSHVGANREYGKGAAHTCTSWRRVSMQGRYTRPMDSNAD